MNLLIYACAAHLQWCSTFSVLIANDGPSMHACGLAQIQVAQWAGQNEGWHIERWECKPITVAEVTR